MLSLFCRCLCLIGCGWLFLMGISSICYFLFVSFHARLSLFANEHAQSPTFKARQWVPGKVPKRESLPRLRVAKGSDSLESERTPSGGLSFELDKFGWSWSFRWKFLSNQILSLLRKRSFLANIKLQEVHERDSWKAPGRKHENFLECIRFLN